MTSTVDPAAFAQLQLSAGRGFVAELLDTFAEEAPQLLRELRAAQAEDADERFRRASHALKSNGHTFGAARFAEIARALELGGPSADPATVAALAEEFERALAALRVLAARG